MSDSVNDDSSETIKSIDEQLDKVAFHLSTLASRLLQARGEIRHGPTSVKLRLWRSSFDLSACSQLIHLVRHGLTCNWEFAAMTAANFMEAVDNKQDQMAIEDHMADLGLACDTKFTEEMLRLFQCRPQNILTDRATAEVALQPLSTFMDPNQTEFMIGELRMLKRMSLTTVLNMIVFDEQFIGTMIAARGDNEITRETAPKIGRKLKRVGLWYGFKPTKAERFYMKAHGLE